MATKKQQPETKVIKGYKGFDKNLKCRDKQYALNSEFSEPDAVICEKGIHFCEHPLDILAYYPAADSRFAEVEGTGKTVDHPNEDSKIACTHLKVKDELSLHALINAAVSFVFERTVKTKEKNNDVVNKQCGNTLNSGAASNSGERGAASNSGYRGAASNSGESGAAFTIGNYSTAITDAKDSVAVGVGYKNKAMGNIGNWIVLAERKDNLEILDIKAVIVDGKTIKANTFYSLIKGQFVAD